MSIPRSPGLIQRQADRITTRLLRLTPATTTYEVIKDLPVKARDGTPLLVDHFAPSGTARGTILVRTPYGNDPLQTALYARPYAARGYHVVLARCRGTYGSGGVWDPMVNEAPDGEDTVAWLRNEAWFGGKFATLGASYQGFAQWALMADPPPELITAIVQVGPHDIGAAAYEGGAFTINDFLGWGDAVAHQEDHGLLRGAIRMAGTSRRLTAPLNRLPVAHSGRGLLAEHHAWFETWLATRDLSSAHWTNLRMTESLDRVNFPVLLHTGWQDIFLRQTIQQYRRLADRHVDVAMTVGPWGHLDIETKAVPMLLAENLAWLAAAFAKEPPKRAAAVRVFVTGAKQWRQHQTWPPPSTSQDFYLHPGGRLLDNPCDTTTLASFTYHPSHPTPSVGGRLMFSHGGYKDDSALSIRDDTLSFTSDPLSALEIAGSPLVRLHHRSDNPNADLFVRLSDVDATGRSTNVSEGFIRLDPATESEVDIPLDPVAHRFNPGHRMRITIAGGSFPRWERNLGTDQHPAYSLAMAPSTRSIDLARSRVSLPAVVPNRPAQRITRC